jgi:hypothetical protein
VQLTIPGETPPSSPSSENLDAGASISLTTPFETYPDTVGEYSNDSYEYTFDQTATSLTAGQYTIAGTGGKAVGPFTATYSMPPLLFTWTDRSSITAVNRAAGVTVHWTEGDPAGIVQIVGTTGIPGPNGADAADVWITCTAAGSAGMFTIPPYVLLALPPNRGELEIEYFSPPQFFSPPAGVDSAWVQSAFNLNTFVNYQ